MITHGGLQGYVTHAMKMKETPTISLVDQETIIGIEVEVENINHVPNALEGGLWHHVADNSLRLAGREFVSVPMYGKTAEIALEQLYKYLNKINAVCSPRTSVHVHVNTQDLNLGELYKFIMLYIVYERVLYDFVGNNRDKNNFCIPLYSYPHTWGIFKEIQNGKFNFSKNWLKYTGFNLKPLMDGRGTIEFRHFSGSKDLKLVATWINLILSLKKAAQSFSVDELVGLIRSNAVYFLTRQVFGTFANLFDNKPLESLIQQGFDDLALMEQVVSSPTMLTYTETSDLYLKLKGGK